MPSDPGRSFNLVITGLAGLNFVPHIFDHPMIVLFVTIPCIVWRVAYEYQKVPLPGKLLKTLLIAGIFGFVINKYGRVVGVEAASALLVCSVALKLIDNVSYRDAMVLIFLNFLLLMIKFLVSQTLSMTLFAVFNLVAVTALLFQLHKGKDVKFDTWTLLRNGLRLTLQTAPLLVLLFLVFPRFNMGFFSLNNPTEGGKGFNDSLRPGEVGKLVVSKEVAFRVKMTKEIPGGPSLYWKGGILDLNKGMAWYKSSAAKREWNVPQTKYNPDAVVEQEITLEPQFGKWLFALDVPANVEFSESRKQRQARIAEGSVFRLTKSTQQRVLYTARSFRTPQSWGPLYDKDRYLGGVREASPQVLELVNSLKGDATDVNEIGRRIMSYYRRNFRYTLEPGALKTESVDEFLFEKKVGFCEHFAASFAYLMRVAGIPSRLVIGFQGGKPNALLPDYITLTGADAHSWVEVFDSKTERWLRMDPTGVVAPLRLELGGQVYHDLPEDVVQAGIDSNQAQQIYNSSWFQKYFGQIVLYGEFAAIQWNEFLLKYNQEGQRDLLRKMGLGFLNSQLLGLVSVLVLIGFFFYRRYRSQQKEGRISKEQQLFVKLEGWLSRQGVTRPASEGPRTFLERAEERTGNAELQRFSQLYISGQYSAQPLTDEQYKALQLCYKEIVNS